MQHWPPCQASSALHLWASMKTQHARYGASANECFLTAATAVFLRRSLKQRVHVCVHEGRCMAAVSEES